jgi:hypothetical protein
VIFHAQMHRITNRNPERLAYRGWNHKPSFFPNLSPSLKFYLSLHIQISSRKVRQTPFCPNPCPNPQILNKLGALKNGIGPMQSLKLPYVPPSHVGDTILAK